MSIRTERVASLLRHEIGAILTREYNAPEYGFITVTEVRVSADMKTAKIYFSIFGDEQKQQLTMKLLEDQKQHIRSLLASRVRLKFAPALQFFHDTTMEQVDKINKLITKIHEDDDKKGRGPS